MKKYYFIKCLVISIIILFYNVSVLPSISGNTINEINNHNVIYPQKINNYDTLNIYIYRLYCFGSIYNLTINNDEKIYEFKSDNIRVLHIYFHNITDYEITYHHQFGHTSKFLLKEYYFKGILTPTFVCGYFYHSISGNAVVEKNNQNIVDLEKIDNSKTLFNHNLSRVYFFGIISNLEFYENLTIFLSIIVWSVYVYHYDNS